MDLTTPHEITRAMAIRKVRFLRRWAVEMRNRALVRPSYSSMYLEMAVDSEAEATRLSREFSL